MYSSVKLTWLARGLWAQLKVVKSNRVYSAYILNSTPRSDSDGGENFLLFTRIRQRGLVECQCRYTNCNFQTLAHSTTFLHCEEKKNCFVHLHHSDSQRKFSLSSQKFQIATDYNYYRSNRSQTSFLKKNNVQRAKFIVSIRNKQLFCGGAWTILGIQVKRKCCSLVRRNPIIHVRTFYLLRSDQFLICLFRCMHLQRGLNLDYTSLLQLYCNNQLEITYD